MNAIEARASRHRAGKSTLEVRLRRNPAMAQRIDKRLARLGVEQQMIDALQRHHACCRTCAPQASRRRAGKPTLEERLRRDPDMAQRVDKHLARLRREQQRLDAMQY